MKTDGEIRESMDVLYKIRGDKEAMMLAEMREKAIMDEQSRLNGVRKEGIEKENSSLRDVERVLKLLTKKFGTLNVCLEYNSIMLNDEAQKIIFNTKGFMKDLSEELLEFLRYVENSTDDAAKSAKGNLVKSIHKVVQEVKNDDSMEVEFMTLLERDREKIEQGREEEKIEIVIEMLKDGEPIEKIAKYSKLSENDILELKKKL